MNMSMVDFHLDSNALAVLFELIFLVAPAPRNEHFLDGRNTVMLPFKSIDRLCSTLYAHVLELLSLLGRYSSVVENDVPVFI